MKKLLALLAAALIALSACSAPQPADGDEPAPAPADPAMTGAVPNGGKDTLPEAQSDEQAPETIDDSDVSGERISFHNSEYYTRDAVIARGEYTAGSFTASEQWAMSYAMDAYPGYFVTSCRFVSGFVAPDGLFDAGLGGGFATWRLSLAEEGGESFDFDVQTAFFEEGMKIYLSGILCGKDIFASRPAAYAYLRQDSRFAARMKQFPTVAVPADMISLDAAALLGLEHYAEIAMLDGTHAAALEVLDYGYGENAAPAFRLYIFDCVSGEISAEKEYGDMYYQSLSAADGAAVLRFSGEDGGDIEITVSADGAEQRRTLSGEREYALSEGQNILERGGSLYLSDRQSGELTLLLKGVQSDGEDGEACRFYARLDDARFVYYIQGWEWSCGTGVYDTASGKSFLIAVDAADFFGRYPVKLAGTLLFTDTGGYDASELAVTDLETMQTRPLGLKNIGQEGFHCAVSDDGGSVAVYCETGGIGRLEIYSADSSALLKSWSFDLRAAYFQALSFAGGRAALVLHRYDTDSEWIYFL